MVDIPLRKSIDLGLRLIIVILTFHLYQQVGQPVQNVNLLISTAGYDTWVIDASVGCPNGLLIHDCPDSRGMMFHTNESTSWVADSIFTLAVEDSLGLASDGNFGFDTITLGWQGAGGPSETHQVIGAIADPRYWVGSFGLRPTPTNFTDFNSPQPSYLQSLKTSNRIPSLSWGYTAGAYYRTSTAFGSLTLGGYDAAIAGDKNITIPFDPDTSRSLSLNINTISTNSSSNHLLPGGLINSFIDSTVAQIWLPQDACDAFANTFALTWDADAMRYAVNESTHNHLIAQNPTITFNIANPSAQDQILAITLPYKAFDLNMTDPDSGNSTRYFPLMPAANSTQYTIGRTFLQESYIAADWERNHFTISNRKWQGSDQSDIVTIHSLNSSGVGLSTGAIAGIVVGILVLFIIICAGTIYARRQDSKKATSFSVLHVEREYERWGKRKFKSLLRTRHEPDSSEVFEAGSGREIYEVGTKERHELSSGYDERLDAIKVDMDGHVVSTNAELPVYELVGDMIPISGKTQRA